MTLSDYDQENISSIIAGNGDWFTAHLLRLIVKADYENRAKLAAVFPEEVAAIEKWEMR